MIKDLIYRLGRRGIFYCVPYGTICIRSNLSKLGSVSCGASVLAKTTMLKYGCQPLDLNPYSSMTEVKVHVLGSIKAAT
jgi:hypothetical protein